MAAHFVFEALHFVQSNVRRVGHDQIKLPSHAIKPISLNDVSPRLHSVQHRIRAGLKTGSFAQVGTLGTFYPQQLGIAAGMFTDNLGNLFQFPEELLAFFFCSTVTAG